VELVKKGATEAYFAGFFDGEGYVGIARNSKKQFVLECSVTNTDYRPLAAMAEIYGGKIILLPRRKPQHKQAWRWSCQSKVAECFLRKIYTHTIVKRERIEIALEFRKLFKGLNILPRGNARPTFKNTSKTIRVLEARKVFHDLIGKLNHRGVIHGSTA
jgi:hypothetical protein